VRGADNTRPGTVLRAPSPDSAPATPARSARAADIAPAAPRDSAFRDPVGFVNDLAEVMDEPGRAQLESFLDQVRRKTGVQFAVLTLRTTAPLDPLQYKTEAYRRWFHGNRTSLLLLVALDERRIAFETGYELEGILPDALEARIIRQEMAPRFRAGNYADGITAAVLRTSAVIAKDRGVTLEWDGRELRYGRERGQKGGRMDLLAVIVFLVVVLVLRTFMGGMIPGGRRRHGGWWYLGPGPWGGGFGGGFGGLGGGGGGGGGFGGFGGGGGFGSGGGGGSGGW
jgi:uncharacterized protein